MAYIQLCDLCGKPMTYGEPQRNFKIKELKTNWWEHCWVTLDVHKECAEKLFCAAKEKNEGNFN